MARTAYNAKDCVITVDGVYITGVGEDMVTGAKDEEFFSTTVGAQGDVAVNEINNPLGTITLTLQGTSPQNEMMLRYGKTNKEFPVWVVNKTLKEKFGGTQARIKNYPELENGSELGDRVYEIGVFDYDVIPG